MSLSLYTSVWICISSVYVSMYVYICLCAYFYRDRDLVNTWTHPTTRYVMTMRIRKQGYMCGQRCCVHARKTEVCGARVEVGCRGSLPRSSWVLDRVTYYRVGLKPFRPSQSVSVDSPFSAPFPNIIQQPTCPSPSTILQPTPYSSNSVG